jgi:hypothetical protein
MKEKNANGTNKKWFFLLKSKRDYNQITEVTVLHSLFDWKLKLSHFYLENKNKILGSGKELHPLKRPIYRTK